MTPNNPVDADGGWRWLLSWGGDDDDDGGGDADVGGNLGPTTKKTVALAVVAAPGGGGVDVPTTIPTTADGDDGVGGGRLPARTSRNRRNRM